MTQTLVLNLDADPATQTWTFRRSLEALDAAARASALGAEQRTQFYEDLLHALDATKAAWCASRAVHEEIREEIVEVDVALAARVARLRETEARLAADLLQLRLAAERVSESEGPLQLGATQALRARILGWVGRCRTYERNMTRWFLEAHFRDRGVSA